MPASVHGEEECCAIRHRKDLLQQEALTPDAGPARRNAVWIPGKPRNQWVLSGNRWWYCHEDGSYTKSDWEKIDGKKYYFDEAGWMVTGWQLIEKHWYYFYDQGEMAANTWVGNYYMKSDGKMAVSEWVQDGRFYVDENGLWVQK